MLWTASKSSPKDFMSIGLLLNTFFFLKRVDWKKSNKSSKNNKCLCKIMHCKYKGTKPWKWPLALISNGANEVQINKKWFQPRFILKFLEKEKKHLNWTSFSPTMSLSRLVLYLESSSVVLAPLPCQCKSALKSKG